MEMSYTMNPHIGKVRAQAVHLVKLKGWSQRAVARHLGVSPGTVNKWVKKAPSDMMDIHEIETESSRPKHSPRKTDEKIVKRILEIRDTHRKNGPQLIHAMLKREGVDISFSTVYRILKRTGRIPEKERKKVYHRSGERPKATIPGTLVQMDSIHIMKNYTSYDRFYIITLIDVCSRWAYATASESISTHVALKTMKLHKPKLALASPASNPTMDQSLPNILLPWYKAVASATATLGSVNPTTMPMSNVLTELFKKNFNLKYLNTKNNMTWLNKSINEYLEYYNDQRLHAGIEHKTPNEFFTSVSKLLKSLRPP